MTPGGHHTAPHQLATPRHVAVNVRRNDISLRLIDATSISAPPTPQ
jgi:hypothetical protein